MGGVVWFTNRTLVGFIIPPPPSAPKFAARQKLFFTGEKLGLGRIFSASSVLNVCNGAPAGLAESHSGPDARHMDGSGKFPTGLVCDMPARGAACACEGAVLGWCLPRSGDAAEGAVDTDCNPQNFPQRLPGAEVGLFANSTIQRFPLSDPFRWNRLGCEETGYGGLERKGRGGGRCGAGSPVLRRPRCPCTFSRGFPITIKQAATTPPRCTA